MTARDRRTYLGSGDIAAILEIDPFRTPLDVWAQKLGKVPPPEPTEAMLRGLEAEESTLLGYKRRTGRVVRRTSQDGTIDHPTLKMLAATPDALSTETGFGSGRLRVVEAKLVGVFGAKHWGESGDPAGVPARGVAQGLYQWAHVRLAFRWPDGEAVEADTVTDFAAAIGTELRIYSVPMDEAQAQELLDFAAWWWREHIEGNRMPPPSAPGDERAVRSIFPRVEMVQLEDATPDEEQLARAYDAARAEESIAKAAKAVAQARLQAAIATRAGIKGSWGKATWTNNKEPETDWKGALTEKCRAMGWDLESVLQGHRKATGKRVLRVTVNGGTETAERGEE